MVMTPSRPTLSMASASSSAMASSWAERAATRATCSRFSTGTAIFFNSATTVSTAFSMPDFKAIPLAPAATFRNPWRTIAWANTTDVVVPSPTTSLVLAAASLTSCAPMFS